MNLRSAKRERRDDLAGAWGDCGSNLNSIYELIKFCSIFPFRLLTVILSLSEVIDTFVFYQFL